MFYRRLVLVSLLILLAAAQPAGAAVTSWTLNIYPASGTTTGSILLLIRSTPNAGANPVYIYVFYDDVCLIQRQTAATTGGGYSYSWDIKITPPATATYTSYGYHTVTIRIEESDGTASSKSLSYRITDGAPLGEWWKNLPAGYYAYLKGVKGDTGSVGPQGEVGATGPAGPRGATGTQGPQGEVGPQGATGDGGAQGAVGRDFDPTLSYSALIMSIGALIVSGYLFTRVRKAG